MNPWAFDPVAILIILTWINRVGDALSSDHQLIIMHGAVTFYSWLTIASLAVPRSIIVHDALVFNQIFCLLESPTTGQLLDHWSLGIFRSIVGQLVYHRLVKLARVLGLLPRWLLKLW